MFLPHTRLCQPQALDAESSPEKWHATCSDAHWAFWRTNALQKRPRNWCLTMCITVLHTGCAAEASRFTSAYGGTVDHWCEFTRAMRLFCLCPPHPRWYSTSCGNGCQCSLLTWLALKLMSTCTANRWTRRRLPAKHIPLFIPSSRASPHRTRKKNTVCVVVVVAVDGCMGSGAMVVPLVPSRTVRTTSHSVCIVLASCCLCRPPFGCQTRIALCRE